jgi:hypothetical protein
MAKGFKTGGRKKGSKNKPKELTLTPSARAATAGNAKVHAKIIPALKLTPLDIMLANMNLASSEVIDMEAYIAQAYARAAAPFVHPKLQSAAPAPEQEMPNPLLEADPLREHIEEMAKVFRIKSTNGNAA